MRTVVSLIAFVGIFFITAPGLPTQTGDQAGHVEWVANALNEMQSIKVGMKRRELLRVFTTEGGISTASWRQYVYKGCPYFKVRVEFQLAKSTRDRPEESLEDTIIKISAPYLENTIID